MPEAEYKPCHGEPEVEFGDHDAFIVCRRVGNGNTYLYVWTAWSDQRWAHGKEYAVDPVDIATDVRDAYEDGGIDALLDHHSLAVAAVGRALADED